jgi:DNA-directed RNA polymerase specialized sigma24 family protein
MKSHLINDRCTENDYRTLFKSSAQDLRWLCYTLTGNDELTEKVLDAALEQSLKGATEVFRGWMLSWARRLIIKFCVSTVQPWNSQLAQSAFPLRPMAIEANSSHLMRVLNLPSDALQQGLLQLDVLSRFVFVLRGLEGYSRRDTSLLLNIDDRACEWIYLWAASALYSGIEQSEGNSKKEEQLEYAFAIAGD